MAQFIEKGEVILKTLKTYAVLTNFKVTPDNNITAEDKYCKMKRKAIYFSSDDNLDSEYEFKPNNNHKLLDLGENDNVVSKNTRKESENIVEQEIGIENLEIKKKNKKLKLKRKRVIIL